MKNYTQAPLPFQGQKRRFLNKFREALVDYPSDGIYVDLFGGSGLLSHTVKQFYPEARVVWNDFDDFRERLDNIDKTNELIANVRELLKDEPRDKKVRTEVRIQLLKLIAKQPYVDYVTLSSNILFSGKYKNTFDELQKETFYNVVRQSDYYADGYLDGVERLSGDYKDIYRQFEDAPGVVFLVDPPYLSTDTKTYGSNGYWKLRDYLDVLNVLDGSNYFYFTSNKSQIVELCQWIETRSGELANPFKNSTISTTGGSVNFNANYTDIMLHKKATD
jgi:site-specific DNA-adenine methylase